MSNGHDKSALFFGYGVNEAKPLIVEISDEQNTKTRDIMLKLRPSSTSHRQRRHRSVNNVKSVAFAFEIWAVNMLSAR